MPERWTGPVPWRSERSCHSASAARRVQGFPAGLAPVRRLAPRRDTASADRTGERRVVGSLHRAAQGGGMTLEQPRHLGPRLQAAFSIGQPVLADVVDGPFCAQASQHIGQNRTAVCYCAAMDVLCSPAENPRLLSQPSTSLAISCHPASANRKCERSG